MSGSNPMVSVILPVFNGADFVAEAIDSVLNQTFKCFELIVVDDGSKDNSEGVMRKFTDNRIIYIKHKINRGVSAARNTGIKASKGKYIAFIDQDDIWMPEKIEKQIAVFESQKNNELGAVFTDLYIERGNNKKLISYNKKFDFSVVQAPSVAMIKRSTFDMVGVFDESFTSGREDDDLWIRMFIEWKLNFEVLKEALVIKREVNNATQKNFGYKTFLNMLLLSRKHHRLFGFKINEWVLDEYGSLDHFLDYLNKNKVSVVIFGAGGRGKMALNWLIKKRISCKFFVDNNKNKWGNSLAGIKIRPPSFITSQDVVFLESAWYVEIGRQLTKMNIKRFIFV